MLDDSSENCIKSEAIFYLSRLKARRIVHAVWKSRNSCAAGPGLNDLDCQAFSIFVLLSPAHRHVSFEYETISDTLPRTKQIFFHFEKRFNSLPCHPRQSGSGCIGVSRQTAYNIWFIHIQSGEYIWRILSGQKYQLLALMFHRVCLPMPTSKKWSRPAMNGLWIAPASGSAIS